MRIFGRERDSLRISQIKASRALYVSEDIQEINIAMITEEGQRLDLQLPPRLAHALVSQVSSAYQAINPPLNSGGNWAATWQGMDDNG